MSMTPRWRAALDLRRKGYRKVGVTDPNGDVLVYRHRSWVDGCTHDKYANVQPDGSVRHRQTVRPGTHGM